MGEKQLRSRSMVTRIEIVSQVLESDNDSRELDCNVAENESMGNKESNTQTPRSICVVLCQPVVASATFSYLPRKLP
jgi:hypothetical protein